VHQDTGLITLLPASTTPGLEILDRNNNLWIPVEKFLQPNDILLFGGLVMQKITCGVIQAAVHRVVREPKMERYSMPLEVKPNNDTILKVVETAAILEVNVSSESLFDNTPVHEAICDNCGYFICGTRFKCTMCEDYDLCEPCKVQNTKKPYHTHEFKQISKPDSLFTGKGSMPASEFLGKVRSRRELQKMWRYIEP